MRHGKSQIKCETLRNCAAVVGRRREGSGSGESSGAYTCTVHAQLHRRAPTLFVVI